MRSSLTAVPTLLVAVAMVVAACGLEPSPAPPTSTPIAVAPSPTPTPVSLPTPIIAASIVCPQSRFDPPATLQCNEAVDAALAALPMDHAAVLEASFDYRLPCAPNARCAAVMGRDTGFVVITSETGRLEVVRVTQAPDGTMTTEGPESYNPPEAATGPTVEVGEWTATCLDVPTADCTGIAGLFINNLAWSGQSILDQSGGKLFVVPRADCPTMPTWVDGPSCWQALTDITDRQVCMVIARQTISSPFGFAQVGGDEMSGRAVPPVGYPECV
jgi:hypothetical protein